MRWPFILATSTLFVALLVGLVLWVSARQRKLFLQDRSPVTQIIGGEPVTTFISQRDNQQPSIDTTQPHGVEAYNSVVIQRGEYLDYDTASRTLRLKPVPAIETAPDTVTIDLTGIETAHCWPETAKDNEGTTIFLRDAYIPFAPDRPLSWPGETIRPWEDVQGGLTRSSYLILRVSQPKPEDDKLRAAQVVVLGC